MRRFRMAFTSCALLSIVSGQSAAPQSAFTSLCCVPEHRCRIWEAHKIYLLTRDMASIAATFGVFFAVAIVIGPVGWKTAAIYVAALIAQYLLVASAARNYGVRFVLNVLSQESLAG